MNVVRRLKRSARQTIETLPFGRDMVLYLERGGGGITYRGVYDSYDAAHAAVNPAVGDHYDRINVAKQERIGEGTEELDSWFFSYDYPLAFWLQKLLHGGARRVFELGGSLGHFFYSAEQLLGYPEDLHWTVAELPAAVELGARIAAERDEARLSFVDSSSPDVEAPIDVFMTAGTLQYMESSLEDIIGRFAQRPKHVLVHKLPSHASRTFWTLQNLGSVEMPYRVSSRSGLAAAMSGLGYRLVGEWVQDRTIEIPFHLDLVVEGYLGYAFTLDRP